MNTLSTATDNETMATRGPREIARLLAALLFAVCVAPTFISYQPYSFTWDDSDYLARAVAASRAFWSGDVHGLGAAMVGIRPPAMTFLGLPWGALTSWSDVGKCFVALAVLISLLVTCCFYLLLRVGVRPLFLVLASICVCVSLGPYPQGTHPGTIWDAHAVATGFMSDTLLAWTVLAAVLLIPYEARTPCRSIGVSITRGGEAPWYFLWGRSPK